MRKVVIFCSFRSKHRHMSLKTGLFLKFRFLWLSCALQKCRFAKVFFIWILRMRFLAWFYSLMACVLVSVLDLNLNLDKITQINFTISRLVINSLLRMIEEHTFSMLYWKAVKTFIWKIPTVLIFYSRRGKVWTNMLLGCDVNRFDWISVFWYLFKIFIEKCRELFVCGVNSAMIA